MPATTPPTLDPAPVAPSTSSPSTFAALADAFLAWLVIFRTQLVALAANIFGNATVAYDAAVTATTQAQAAVSGVNAQPWVSGTTYAVGDVRYSPINFVTYRRKTAGAGTTDPSLDPTNWRAPLELASRPCMIVQERQNVGVAGPTFVTGDNERTLNTVLSNTIPGASLSSGRITLPPGTYVITARSAICAAAIHQLGLFNSSGGAGGLVGQTLRGGSTSTYDIAGVLSGVSVINVTTSFYLCHWVSAAVAATNGGAAANNASVGYNVFAQVEIFKEA